MLGEALRSALLAIAAAPVAQWSAAVAAGVGEHDELGARVAATAIGRDRDTALEMASAALTSAPGAAWPLVFDVFQQDPQLGRDIFERVASGETDLGSDLDDDALHRLLDWLLANFPAAEDPAWGDGFMTPRMQAARVRDRLLVGLAQRGTDQASAGIADLAARYPSPGMTSLRSQARETRLARWTAPTPQQIIQLAQSSDARIVLSSDHLQQAVMASLHRIERRLQENTPPSVRELWNTRGRPSPKHEEELSTWLAARLDEDLRVGGRVIDASWKSDPARPAEDAAKAQTYPSSLPLERRSRALAPPRSPSRSKDAGIRKCEPRCELSSSTATSRARAQLTESTSCSGSRPTSGTPATLVAAVVPAIQKS